MTYIYKLLYVTELHEFTAKVKLCQYLADIYMQVYRQTGREELRQKYKICLLCTTHVSQMQVVQQLLHIHEMQHLF